MFSVLPVSHSVQGWGWGYDVAITHNALDLTVQQHPLP